MGSLVPMYNADTVHIVSPARPLFLQLDLVVTATAGYDADCVGMVRADV